MMAISTGRVERTDIGTQGTSKKLKDGDTSKDSFAGLLNLTSAKADTAAYKSDKTSNGGAGTSGLKLNTDCNTAELGRDVNDASVKAKDQTYNNSLDDSAVSADRSGDDSAVKDFDKISGNSRAENDEAGYKNELISDIKDAVKKALGLSDEELNDILEDFGIDVQSLINPDALKSFVLAAQNSTEVDLLVDENLSALLQNVTDAVNDVLEAYGVDGGDINQITELIAEYDSNIYASEETDGGLKTTDNKADIESSDDIRYSADTDNMPAADDSRTEVKLSVDAAQTGEANQNFGAQDNGTAGSQSQIAVNLNQAIDNTFQAGAAEGTAAYSDALEQADIVRQIIDSIKVNITKETSSMTVQLNPENLGRVQVSVANRNGVMQAQIVAETENARHAIENNIAILRETFDNHELKVDAIEVMVASEDFFSRSHNDGQEDNDKSRQTQKTARLSFDGDADGEMLSDEDINEMSVMEARGSSVSYSI